MISIIIVTYNSIAVLPSCLRALSASQGANHFDVIVVDNASSDDTCAWLDTFITEDRHGYASITSIKLEENRGFAYANNRGLEQAAGDHLLLLNPDTEVEPTTILSIARLLDDDSGVGVAGCRLVLRDGRLDQACRRSFPTLWNSFTRMSGLSLLFPRSQWLASYNLTYLDEYQSYEVDCISGAFLMIRKIVYDTIGGLDEDFFMYGEDIDWCYRIKKSGYRVLYDGTVSTLHLKGANGGKRSDESLRSFYDTMLLYYQKHYAGSNIVIMQIIIKSVLWSLYQLNRVKNKLKYTGEYFR